MTQYFERRQQLPTGLIRFREYTPTGPLARSVRCFWTFSASEGRWDGLQHTILPDGCTDLCFTFGARPWAGVIGPMSRPRTAPLGGTANLAVSFFPGCSHPFLDCDVAALQDTVCGLETFWGADAQQVLDLLASADDTETRLRLLQRELERRASRIRRVDDQVDRAVRWMYETRGAAVVGDLAREVGLCERQLRRRVALTTGYTPKELLRVLRFQHTAQAWLATGAAESADLAARFGYADQAHLIREFQEMSLFSPRRFARAVQGGECPIYSIPTGWALGYNRRR